jgi:hypothetical protein
MAGENARGKAEMAILKETIGTVHLLLLCESRTQLVFKYFSALLFVSVSCSFSLPQMTS